MVFYRKSKEIMVLFAFLMLSSVTYAANPWRVAVINYTDRQLLYLTGPENIKLVFIRIPFQLLCG